jgi:hypothetical protein
VKRPDDIDAVSLIDAVLGDVVPDVEDVGRCQRPAGGACHGLAKPGFGS